MASLKAHGEERPRRSLSALPAGHDRARVVVSLIAGFAIGYKVEDSNGSGRRPRRPPPRKRDASRPKPHAVS